MRVLHVLETSEASYGGPIRVAHGLAEELVADGHEAEIWPKAAGALSLLGTRFWVPSPAQVRGLELATRSADVLHIHGLWAPSLMTAAWVARHGRVPYVVSVHGMLRSRAISRHRFRKRLVAGLERRKLRAAAAVHCLHRGEVEDVRRFGIEGRCVTIPNGVDLRRFESLPGRAALEHIFPRSRGRCVALFLGRLHRQKGLDVLLRAIREMVRIPRDKTGADLHVIVAGSLGTAEARRFAWQYSDLERKGVVTFVGELAGVERDAALGGADFFVQPSRWEGDSMSVKEALAAGLPVVTTHGAIPVDVDAAGAGILVDVNPESVSRALLRLLSDQDLRRRMSSSARRLAAQFDRRRIGRSMLQVYCEVTDDQRTSRALVC